VARYAVQIGQTAYRAANVSKAPADFQRAISILEFANRTQATPEGKFLLGATALGYGQQQLQAAQSTKSCTAVNAARTAFNTAQINLPEGGKFNPQATTQLLSALGQLSPIPDQFAKALKCGGGSTSSR
jgi:hypothetical protein